MIHILASHVHKENSIYNKMEVISKNILEIVDEDYYELITKINPQKIIENQSIEKCEYKKVKKNIFF